MKNITLILGLFLALPAVAQDSMTGPEFDAYTKGKTLYFGRGGVAYGAEVYLDNQRVKWSFLDGECKDGRWYEQAGMICFTYEDTPDPQCWRFVETAGGLVATFENNPDSTDLYEAQDIDQELLCLGPKVGV